jgi:hypothetical protein
MMVDGRLWRRRPKSRGAKLVLSSFIPKPVDFNQLKAQHANCPTQHIDSLATGARVAVKRRV